MNKRAREQERERFGQLTCIHKYKSKCTTFQPADIHLADNLYPYTDTSERTKTKSNNNFAHESIQIFNYFSVALLLMYTFFFWFLLLAFISSFRLPFCMHNNTEQHSGQSTPIRANWCIQNVKQCDRREPINRNAIHSGTNSISFSVLMMKLDLIR